MQAKLSLLQEHPRNQLIIVVDINILFRVNLQMK